MHKCKPILLVLLILVFGVSAAKAIPLLHSNREAEQVSQQFAELAVETRAEVTQPEEETETEEYHEPPPIDVDFEKLLEMNPDVYGWLYLPDSRINYPVMRSRDNEDYLYHLPDGTANVHGSIFIDCNNDLDLTDDNIIIYGHSMQDGSMFGRLGDFAKQSYYDTHQDAYLLTPDKNYRLEIFAAYVTDIHSDVYTILFAGQGKIDLLRSSVARSDVVTTPRVTSEDTIVTMSTCSYQSDEARYVVMALLKEM